MFEEYDVDELRDELKNYYGTAAFAFGEGNNMGPMADLLNVYFLSDEEVIEEARNCGLID